MENNDEIWQKSSIQCKLNMIIRGARTGHTEQYRWSFVERQIVSSKSMSKNASENVSNQNKLFWWFLRNSLFWHFNSRFVLRQQKLEKLKCCYDYWDFLTNFLTYFLTTTIWRYTKLQLLFLFWNLLAHFKIYSLAATKKKFAKAGIFQTLADFRSFFWHYFSFNPCRFQM